MRWFIVLTALVFVACGAFGADGDDEDNPVTPGTGTTDASSDARADSATAGDDDDAAKTDGAAIVDGSSDVIIQPAGPQVVRTYHDFGTIGSLSFTLVPAAAEGDSIIVVVENETSSGAYLSEVRDEAGVAYPTATASVNSCAHKSEIRYATKVKAGTHSIDVVLEGKADVQAWIIHARGLSAFVTASSDNQPVTGSRLVTPAVAAIDPVGLVVSTATACGNIGNIDTSIPFINAPAKGGGATEVRATMAYRVTAEGAGAAWACGDGISTSSSTAAFK